MMYIVLSGRIEARIDLSKRYVTDQDIKNLEIDLELDKSEVSQLGRARLQHNPAPKLSQKIGLFLLSKAIMN